MRPLQQDLINRWSLCLLAACLIFPLEKASLSVCYRHDLRAERFFKGHLNTFFFQQGRRTLRGVGCLILKPHSVLMKVSRSNQSRLFSSCYNVLPFFLSIFNLEFMASLFSW